MKLTVKFFASIFLVFFSAASLFSQTDISELKWNYIESPVKDHLDRISLNKDGSGFITGSYIFGISKNGIEIFNPQPPSLSIDVFFALSKDKIWAAKSDFSNQSNIYFFDGWQWKQISNPLANQISFLKFFANNTGWIGGDRELVFFDGKSFKPVYFPSIHWSVKDIFGESEKYFYMLTTKGIVYNCANGVWTKSLEKVNALSASGDKTLWAESTGKIYYLQNENWALHSELPEDIKLNALYVTDKTELWAAADNGMICHYTDGKWNYIKLTSEKRMLDIKVPSPDNGWCVGEEGLIFYLSPAQDTFQLRQVRGFTREKIISISREINNEYGVAIDDLNGDGLLDVYTVCIFDPNKLYINKSTMGENGNILFGEEAAERNVTGFIKGAETALSSSIYLGVGLADVDNDSDADLYLCDLAGTNKLFLNNGSGYFKDVSKESNRGSGLHERSNAGIFGDVDNDGDLDLFVTNEESTNRLFLNDGNGFFTEVTKEAGLLTVGGGMSAAFADIDYDNKLDLCVVNWAAKNILYKNVSDKNGVKFIDISDEAGVSGQSYTKSNSVNFADVDNDGDLDLFITNRKVSNELYLNDGKGIFKEVTGQMIPYDSMLSYGAVFADFDNDGYVDLYVANVGDNIFYKNIDGKEFIDVTKEFNASLGGYSTGVASGDIDNDGDIDLYVANYINDESSLLINDLNNSNFIILSIEGTISNRDAVGTKIWLYQHGHINDENFLKGYREVNSGSGYCSHSSRVVHFGVKPDSNYDIVIYFPASDIKKEVLNQIPGSHITVREEDGLAAISTVNKKIFSRFISHPQTQREFLKFITVFIFIILSYYRAAVKFHWQKKLTLLVHSTLILIYWLQIIFLHEEDFLFNTVLPVSSVIILISLIHLYYERVILIKMVNNERLVIRNKIARDLHDDLASTLSSAHIYTEVLKSSSEAAAKDHAHLVNNISSLLKDASEAVTDIVWNVSPVNDRVDNLFIRLKYLANENCRANSISLHIEESIKNPDLIIADYRRRNIYLVFKEVLNNVIKHSEAKEVKVKLFASAADLEIEIEDDGKGMLEREIQFDNYEFFESNYKVHSVLNGNGLKNIFQRMKEINGKIAISSVPCAGTKISLKAEIT